MATSSTVVLGGTLLSGTASFGPITPPLDVSVIQVAINRINLALLTQPIDWALELSVDGGTTWLPWGGATMAAGTVTTGTGIDGLATPTVLTESTLQVGIPAATANTRLRGSVTTKETVTTTVTVRMS